MKLRTLLLTYLVSHSTFSILCTNLFFFFCIFTFLEIINHNMLEMLPIFFHLHIKMATQKFTPFDKFFFKAQLSQYNLTKLLEPSYKKKPSGLFGQPNNPLLPYPS